MDLYLLSSFGEILNKINKEKISKAKYYLNVGINTKPWVHGSSIS
jgi:hypothetical protein